jgi:hypothetical protein
MQAEQIRGGDNVEKAPLAQAASRIQISNTERTALAAAIISGVLLVGCFHAPLGAVVAGCTMAFAFIVAKRWRKNR